MNQEKIGKFIAEMRKEKKLTQTELAKRIGVSNKAVSKWETGNGIPDYGVFDNLCKEFDIQVSELLNGERNIKDESSFTEYVKFKEKQNKKRNIVVVVISILVVLCCLFGIYFINSYNKINVYKLSTLNERVTLNGSSLVLSNQYTMLDYGYLEFNDINEDDIVSIYLANKVDDTYYKISDYYENEVVTEPYAAESMFARASLDLMPDNMYLLIYYLEDEDIILEEIKIEVELLVTNKKFVYPKRNSIGLDPVDEINELEILNKNEYTYVSNYRLFLEDKGFKIVSGDKCKGLSGVKQCAVLENGNERIAIDYINQILSYSLTYDDYTLDNILFEYKNPNLIIELWYSGYASGKNVFTRIKYDSENDKAVSKLDEDFTEEMKRYIEVLEEYKYEEE